MASFDGTYDNLVQGVSEQVPTSRLPGQVSEQVNMVSDLVTGVRRRPGINLRFSLKSEGVNNNIKAWRTDVGGVSCECYLNCNTGELILLEEGNINEMIRFNSNYLRTPNPQTIRYTGVGDSLFICNTIWTPEATGDYEDTYRFQKDGWFEVIGSNIKQKFEVRVTIGSTRYVGTYTTPDGTQPEHVSQSSTDYVATKLVESLNSKGLGNSFQVERVGSFVFMRSKVSGKVTVEVLSGSVYFKHSNKGIVSDVSKLPKDIPSSLAGGYLVGVGSTIDDMAYFSFNSLEGIWKESPHPSCINGIKNMPVEIYWDGDNWVINEEPYDGCGAGNQETNPNPEFIDWGITGMASYQGRLVLMSGSWVYLSETGKPRNFFRTTVVDLLDSDPIGVGSSSAGSASFEYGLVFNKDLILFSKEHQALIPGMNQALSPKNAHILITSTYTSDMSSSPITLGSSVMYTTPRSREYFGVLEMIPNSYSDSMYNSVDASEHIPRYLKGRCRFSVASSVSKMVLFGSTDNYRELYVHEYMWSGEEKIQKAWHKWEFPNDIAYAFFSGEKINIISVEQSTGTIFISTMDPKIGGGSKISSETYFLDFNITLPVQREDGKVFVKLPDSYSNFMMGNNLRDKIKIAYKGGELNSTEIGADVCNECVLINLNKETTAKEVVVGIPFKSTLVPSPPVQRDHRERPIVHHRIQLIKMYIRTGHTGAFKVIVKDNSRRYSKETGINPIQWLSTSLNLGALPIGGYEGSIIPCRVDASTGEVEFISDGLDEFNVLNLEYTCKTGRMRQRR